MKDDASMFLDYEIDLEKQIVTREEYKIVENSC
jgi:hypothetical protein